MRLLTVMFIISSVVAFGQAHTPSCIMEVDTLTNLEYVITPDKVPTVEGGMQALYKEISKRIKYPHTSEYPIDSKVVVAFIVDADGKIKGTRVIKNIRVTNLGAQLLDIIDDLNWTPGYCDGNPVATLHVIPLIIDVK